MRLLCWLIGHRFSNVKATYDERVTIVYSECERCDAQARRLMFTNGIRCELTGWGDPSPSFAEALKKRESEAA